MSCLNSCEAVKTAANKIKTFATIGHLCVPYTTDMEEAKRWEGPVVVRHTVTGNSGQGIEIVDDPLDIPEAPLYTKYIKKASEWRVHVFQGKAIDVTRKIRDPERTPTNWQVRNHDNGFIFARESGEPPCQSIITHAIEAVAGLGLDFGAVDVIWNQHQERAYVLEVNTAPGLEGETTLKAYTEAILHAMPHLRSNP